MSKHHKHKVVLAEPMVFWEVLVRHEGDPVVETNVRGAAVDAMQAATQAIEARRFLEAARHAQRETEDLGTAAGPVEQVAPVITTKRGRGRIVDVNPNA